jgi:hypothetical protein
MAKHSRSIVEALDRIGDRLESYPNAGNINFPAIKAGELEEVLLFSVNGRVKLHMSDPPPWYFHIIGTLTDLQEEEIGDSRFETVFPFNPPEMLPNIGIFPSAGPPFDRPPVDGRYTSTDTHSGGFSKTNFVFPDRDHSSIVTVGPSIPKLVSLKEGAGQLWVASVAVIVGGSGKYRESRGLGAFNGSANYKKVPDFRHVPEGIQELLDGFPVKVFVNFKLIRREYIA